MKFCTKRGRTHSASAVRVGPAWAAVGFLPLFSFLLEFVPAAHAQTNCFLPWASSPVWHGYFNLQATANVPTSNGGVTTLTNTAQAWYQTTNGPDITPSFPSATFSNAQGSVMITETIPCQPAGNQVLTWRGSGALTNTSVNLVISVDCSYSLNIRTFVLCDYSTVNCPGLTNDNGLDLVLISSDGFSGNLCNVCNMPLPPFGQPLTGTMSYPVSEWTGIPATVTVTWNISPLDLQITLLQSPATTGDLHSFVSTDPITLQATVNPAVANAPVRWTVTGLGPAAGIPGFPQNEVHNTDALGRSTFTFTPSDNAAFVNNRQRLWKTGSRVVNPPLAFEVSALLDQNKITLQSSLSATALGKLEQDDKDKLRQEYVDFQYPVPARSDVVASLGGNYNPGPYPWQLSVDLPGHYNSILATYQGIAVPGFPQLVPPDARVTISRGGGFRNPRYNVAAGSTHNRPGDVSLHVFGRALDLIPVPQPILFNGERTNPDRDAFWFPGLDTAAARQGHAIAEQGCCIVPLGDPREDHIHVDW
jgi:hypothetical protein